MYKKIFSLQAKTMKALAHPRRIEIVRLINDQELCVGKIHQMLDLPQANVSQHLSVLRKTGIVKTQKKGKHVYYSVSHPSVLEACDQLRNFLIDQHQNTLLADEFTRSMQEMVPLTHDPVCKMRVSPKTANFVSKYKGNTYYFCASGCLKKFEKNPEKYLQKSKSKMPC